MKLWPDLALGGNSPVHESFKHSIIVCTTKFETAVKCLRLCYLIVCMREFVSGVKASILTDGFPSSIGSNN